MPKRGLTLGELAEKTAKFDVHCQRCSQLYSIDLASVKRPPEDTLANVERSLSCPNCGAMDVKIKLSDAMRK